MFIHIVQHVVFDKPKLQSPFNIAISEIGETMAVVIDGLLNKIHLAADRGKEPIPKTALVIVGDMSESPGQSSVEFLGKPALRKTAFDKSSKVIGEISFVFCGFPLSRGELTGGEYLFDFHYGIII